MKPLTVIYWTRAILGLVAALICTFLDIISSEITLSLFNGITIALLFYIVTYYIYKPLFITKVEKPSKILSTGIGAYFLTWIVTWTLFFTILTPPSV